MQELIKITHLNGVEVVDSRIIAEELGIQHKNLLDTIKTHKSVIESEFGGVAFETLPLKTNGGIQNTTIAHLTEDQALFIGTLSRNSEKVVRFKAKLVKSFQMARKSQVHEVIKVNFDARGEIVLSARELHKFLGISERFSSWCNRMFTYGFEEGKDYVVCKYFSMHNNQELNDYALGIDMGKEIAMLQRSEKGKQARLYFIECEKNLRQAAPQSLTQSEILLRSAQLLVDHERRFAQNEKMVAYLQEDLQKLKHAQEISLGQLNQLPMSEEAVPEETTRSKVVRLVNAYSKANLMTQQEVWNDIYSKMYYRYRVSVKSYKKVQPKETWIDVMERMGHMEKLFAIISDLFKNSKAQQNAE